MLRWYLAQVKPNADQIARRNLERQNFHTFQPLERPTLVRGGRFTTTLRPFFPGYLFISYPEALAPWSLVNSTYGVARLVKFGGKPAPVPEKIIRELTIACGEDGVMVVGHHLRPGAHVAVASGPFASFVGEIERLSTDHRVMVLLEFMGKETRVSLSAADLRPAPKLAIAKVAGQ